MRPFTIRDVDCQKIIECDDGDMILQHCKGQLLYLHKGYNSLPHYAEFNLRLSKELLSKIKGDKMTDVMKLLNFRSILIDKLEGLADDGIISTYLDLIRKINDILMNM